MRPLKIIATLVVGVLTARQATAQSTHAKLWDKRYGGSSDEGVGSMIRTTDGGFLIGGFSSSGISGDKSETCRGGWDYWIVKLDSSGIKQWDKTFGGSQEERLFSIKQTTDGGYILGGTSLSGISGDKTQPSWGGEDYWIVKTDSSGNKMWDKRFGGTGNDTFSEIDQTNDGGYLLSGYSNSDSSGDKTQHYWPGNAHTDYWIVKINSNGFKKWDRRFGGTDRDEGGVLGAWDAGATFAKCSDGGYLLGGWSLSGIGGDKTEACWDLNGDYWIIRIDSLGNKLWDKRYGGLRYDALSKIKQTFDGGFILGGTTFSSANGNKTVGYCNGFGQDGDYWLIKIDSAGNSQWQQDLGSDGADYFFDICQTADSGYLISGYQPWSGYVSCAKSEDAISTGNAWIIKTNSSGVKVWDKSIFGPWLSNSTCIVVPVGNDCFAVASGSYWYNMGYNTQLSCCDYDYWLLTFCNCSPNDLPNASIASARYTTEICAGSIARFVDVSDCYTSRQWSFPGGDPPASTSQIVSVTYPDTGYYTVMLVSVNPNGTDTAIQSNYVHVIPNPPVPVITQVGDTLVSSPENEYQWYHGTSWIVGASNQTFVPDTSGTFHVCVTSVNGCKSCSGNFYFDMTGIAAGDGAVRRDFTISPNPARKAITVSLAGSWSSGKKVITVYTPLGELIACKTFSSREHNVQLDHLSAGVYFVCVDDQANKIIRKLLIE